MKTTVFQLLHQVIGTLNRPKETIDELNKLLELKSEKDIGLLVEQVRKKEII